MSYKAALTAAGAEVIAFECFGSYQGEWWAKVEWNGEIQYVNGCYGSCSGCDAFEAEFGWDNDPDSPDYQQRLTEFGSTYLECSYTFEEALAHARKYESWDSEAKDMVEWLQSVE